MTPHPLGPGNADHGCMTGPFDDRIYAWLNDPEAHGTLEPEGGAQKPAIGHHAWTLAVEEAGRHERCQPDPRQFGIVVRVVGTDGVETRQIAEPGTTINCILGVLQRSPHVAVLQVLGFDKPEPRPVPETIEPGVITTAEGVTVTSEVPGLQATWAGRAGNRTPMADRPRWYQAAWRWLHRYDR